MKTIILSSFFFLVLSISVSAQKVFEWADYGLAFDLADDFQETVNTDQEFSAEGDGMSISIFPFSDESINDEDITAYTIAAAASLNLDAVDDVNFISLNGFKGGYAEVVSEGTKYLSWA